SRSARTRQGCALRIARPAADIGIVLNAKPPACVVSGGDIHACLTTPSTDLLEPSKASGIRCTRGRERFGLPRGLNSDISPVQVGPEADTADFHSPHLNDGP